MSSDSPSPHQEAGSSGLFVRRGGRTDGPVLVLLHGGLGNGQVWHAVEDLLRERWPGGWLVPDLPGHGQSPRLTRYSYGRMAADVAEAVSGHLSQGVPVHVMGHSLGGVVALTLASGWFGIDVTTVCAMGVKPAWSAEDKAMMAAVAAAPAPVFATRDDAVGFVLAAAAISDVVTTDSPLCDSLVIGDGDHWEAVTDLSVLSVGAADLPGMIAACRAQEVVLAAGEHDPVCPPAELAKAFPTVTVLAGASHYPHLQTPEAVWPLLDHVERSAPWPDTSRPGTGPLHPGPDDGSPVFPSHF
ncbi:MULTISPECIES: alpha/beta fold hydrolase [Streptomyces]|nr:MULTISPECIES: alpha/beta hydrolase [Streptomyces]